MTQEELRKYIDRVLGNSIRCLLPSFWWRKLFHLTLDEVEKKQDNLISGKNIKTVNGESIIGNGDLRVGVKSVGSVDELNTLDAKAGDMATVAVEGEYIPVDLSSCNTLTSTDIVGEWDNLTRIAKIEELHPIDKEYISSFVLSTKSEYGDAMLLVGHSSGTYQYQRYTNGGNESLSKSTVDALLSNVDYRYILSLMGRDNIENAFSFYTKDSSVGDLYIKGDTWEKIGEGEGSGSSEVSSDVITFKLRLNGDFEPITDDDDIAHNKSSYNEYIAAADKGIFKQLQLQCFIQLGENFVTPLCTSWKIAGLDALMGGSTFGIAFYNVTFYKTMLPYDVYFIEGVATMLTNVNTNGVEFIYYRPQYPEAMKPHNARVFEHMNKQFLTLLFVEESKSGNEINCGTMSCAYLKENDYFLIHVDDITAVRVFKLTSDGTLTFVQTMSYVDDTMSAVSTNPVQNKVVKAYVDNAIANGGVTVDDALSTTSVNPVQNKVITTALNNKVDKVSGKQLSTEDFTTALKDKLNSLNNYDDTEIETAISTLRADFDKLVSGDTTTAIKSFNEVVAFLNGITDTQSLQGIIASIEQQIAGKQATISDLDTIRSGAAKGATALQSVPAEYITETELSAKGYATTTQLSSKQDTISDLATIREGAGKGATAIQQVKTINGESIVGEGNLQINVDTSSLATKVELQTLKNEVITNEEVIAHAFDDVNNKIAAINENVKGEAVTKVELQEAIGSVTNTIVENEEITAAAIVDLNNRIAALEAALLNQ